MELRLPAVPVSADGRHVPAHVWMHYNAATLPVIRRGPRVDTLPPAPAESGDWTVGVLLGISGSGDVTCSSASGSSAL